MKLAMIIEPLQPSLNYPADWTSFVLQMTKLVRFAQKKYQFALHSIRMLNKYERANLHGLPFANVTAACADA
jgi:hypothetical protein